MGRRRLQRRVNVTLGLLVVAAAVAVAVSFVQHERVHDASESVRRAESALVSVLRVSIAVREAYAHQAHTFILNDGTHGDHYGVAALAMTRATQVAENAVAWQPEAARALGDVAEEARKLDAQFRDEVLPFVGADRTSIVRPAEAAIFRVERMQKRLDEAATVLAREIDVAHNRVASVTDSSRTVTVLALVIAILVAVASAFSLDRSLSAPLARLEGATESLARGDLRTRVDAAIAARPDELGSLATRFNAMAEALHERERRLLDAERFAAAGKLAAGVAHEINNPLQVILGTARLLERGVDEKGKRDVAAIVDEVERCKTIVGGLLDLSRTPRLQVEDADLRALCEDTAARVAGAVTAAVRVSAKGETRVRADDAKLRQVLTNLLLNAGQAGAQAVALDVDGTDAHAVRITVQDDGPGISAAVAARLFEPFATGRADGTGLGLAVSRALATAHGGTLTLEPSERGARFVLALPRVAHEVGA